MKKKLFVKLKPADDVIDVWEGPPLYEYLLAQGELSSSGVYRVIAQEVDCDDTFYLLAGGMAWYSAGLFDEVAPS
jgi:hypothetical protein